MQLENHMSLKITRLHFCVSGYCWNPVLNTVGSKKSLSVICSAPQDYGLGSGRVFFLTVPRTLETKVKIWEELWQIVGHSLSYFLCSSIDSVAFARDSWETQQVGQMSGLEMVFLTAMIVISGPEVSTKSCPKDSELEQYCCHGFNWWVSLLALPLRLSFAVGRGTFPCHFFDTRGWLKISKAIKSCLEDLCSAVLDLKAVSVHKYKLLHCAHVLCVLEAWICHIIWDNVAPSTRSRTLGLVWRKSHFFMSPDLPLWTKWSCKILGTFCNS